MTKQTDELLQMIVGSTMTQVALMRFLVQEKVINRDKLVKFLEKAIPNSKSFMLAQQQLD